MHFTIHNLFNVPRQRESGCFVTWKNGTNRNNESYTKSKSTDHRHEGFCCENRKGLSSDIMSPPFVAQCYYWDVIDSAPRFFFFFMKFTCHVKLHKFFNSSNAFIKKKRMKCEEVACVSSTPPAEQ